MKAIWSCSRLLRSRFWLGKGLGWPPKSLKTDFSCRTRTETVHEQQLPLIVILTPADVFQPTFQLQHVKRCQVHYFSTNHIQLWSAMCWQSGNFSAFQIATSLWRKKKVQLPWQPQVRSFTFSWWIMDVCHLLRSLNWVLQQIDLKSGVYIHWNDVEMMAQWYVSLKMISEWPEWSQKL